MAGRWLHAATALLLPLCSRSLDRRLLLRHPLLWRSRLLPVGWSATPATLLAVAVGVALGDGMSSENAWTGVEGAFDKGRRLARLVGERRALFILDGLEPLQYAPTSPTPGELKDQGLAALLKGLAATSLGLCVVTTRYALPDLRAFMDKTVREETLTRLSKEAGVALLKKLGVKGNQKEFETLVEDVKGHALTLNLLGTYLRDAHAGDIRKRDRVKLDRTGKQGEHALHVMDAYVQWMAPRGFRAWIRCILNKKEREVREKSERALAVLRLLGLFDRPATADCVAALRKAPAIPGLTEPLVGLAEDDWEFSLSALREAKLLTVNRQAGSGVLVALDAHPLLREYFGRQLGRQQPDAWRAAHRRLYEHLCATTKDLPQPTLEDLKPLYQAVAHGCQAGITEETRAKVFHDRIRRGGEAYSLRKLGAFGSDLGAIACLFKQPWSEFLPGISDGGQAWLLNETAYCLRALGRLTEALEPMRAGVEMGVKQENWKEAAIRASNLRELELTLGEVAGAVRDAEQSVSHADRSGDWGQPMISRCTFADALHQIGRRHDAEARFREAEELQAKGQPETLLYSIRGFRYCDLLLTEAERGAWKASCSGCARPPQDGDVHRAAL